MILSDKTIIELNKSGILFESPLDERQIQPNSVDLTLSDTFKSIKGNHLMMSVPLPKGRTTAFYEKNCIDLAKPIKYKETVVEDNHFFLMPNSFVLAATNEILNIPNGTVGVVCGRSSLARVGLITESAGFVDAGFKGTITLELYNQTHLPIKLYLNMRIAQIYFLKSEESERLYGKGIGSKYSGQIETTGSRIHLDFQDTIIGECANG